MITAIDPGTDESAMIEWDGVKIHRREIMPNADLLTFVRHLAVDDVLAVEMIACYGMPVGKEVFETCLLIGRLQEIWSQRVSTFRKIYRRDVKVHLCNSAKAKDGNIRQALLDRLGPVGVKANQGPCYGISSHLWSALAIAVYAHDVKA